MARGPLSVVGEAWQRAGRQQAACSYWQLYNGRGNSATDFPARTKDEMVEITVNGEQRLLAVPTSIAELVEQLGYDRRRVAVEVNREVVPAPEHPDRRLASGDAVEIVTLVGGGSPAPEPPVDKGLVIGPFTFRSRLITGTG